MLNISTPHNLISVLYHNYIQNSQYTVSSSFTRLGTFLLVLFLNKYFNDIIITMNINNQEIERKFLVTNQTWKENVIGIEYYQGYFISDERVSVRVRIEGVVAKLTIKGKSAPNSISRPEFEYEIPVSDAEFLLEKLCLPGKVRKIRYKKQIENHIWEIDEFLEENKGLIIAEIELSTEDEVFEKPEWIGEEVSYDKKYTNGSLSRNPYKNW